MGNFEFETYPISEPVDLVIEYIPSDEPLIRCEYFTMGEFRIVPPSVLLSPLSTTRDQSTFSVTASAPSELSHAVIPPKGIIQNVPDMFTVYPVDVYGNAYKQIFSSCQIRLNLVAKTGSEYVTGIPTTVVPQSTGEVFVHVSFPLDGNHLVNVEMLVDANWMPLRGSPYSVFVNPNN